MKRKIEGWVSRGVAKSDSYRKLREAEEALHKSQLEAWTTLISLVQRATIPK